MYPFLTFLTLSLAVVLSDSSRWDVLSFDKVPQNVVTFSPDGISLEVAKSASPVVQIFPKESLVSGIRVEGTITGTLTIDPDDALASNDALLRVGILESGSKKLNALQKMTSPDWLKTVDEKLRAAGSGLGVIRCFHLMPDVESIGQTRVNPKSDLFIETISAAPNPDGTFLIEVDLDEPISAQGLWLLADGDDTGSSFHVEITRLEVLP